MLIPKFVKIGAIKYKVIVTEKWEGRAKGDFDGEIFYDREHGHVIYIGAELTDEAQIITFIHEIMHALNATLDHVALDSLAEQLGQVLIENKLLK